LSIKNTRRRRLSNDFFARENLQTGMIEKGPDMTVVREYFWIREFNTTRKLKLIFGFSIKISSRWLSKFQAKYFLFWMWQHKCDLNFHRFHIFRDDFMNFSQGSIILWCWLLNIFNYHNSHCNVCKVQFFIHSLHVLRWWIFKRVCFE
jgi:hypothetical protein